MTIYTAKNLADAFHSARKNTQIIGEEIPETQVHIAMANDVLMASLGCI